MSKSNQYLSPVGNLEAAAVRAQGALKSGIGIQNLYIYQEYQRECDPTIILMLIEVWKEKDIK